jgi:hypothetical protein
LSDVTKQCSDQTEPLTTISSLPIIFSDAWPITWQKKRKKETCVVHHGEPIIVACRGWQVNPSTQIFAGSPHEYQVRKYCEVNCQTVGPWFFKFCQKSKDSKCFCQTIRVALMKGM